LSSLSQLLWCFLICSFFVVWSVEGFTCGIYQSSVQLNELSYPLHPDYSPNRDYFGAPAFCDALVANNVFFVPQNGTEKKDVERQAYSTGFGLGVLTEECRIPAMKLLCASAFRKCQYEPFSAALPSFLGMFEQLTSESEHGR